MNLSTKLAEVMKEVGYVQKDARNEYHKYRYASAEAVLKKVNAALSERGIAVSSAAHLEQYVPAETKEDTAHAIVRLALTFHDGDESLTVEGLGEGSDKGDKATMKANTAALKYAMANAFLISWGDDPEADSETDIEAARRVPLAPQEDPTGDGEIDLSQYPAWQKLIAEMAGKKGVRELREAVMFAALAGWDQDQLNIRADEIGFDPAGVNYVQAVKLRDMLKRERLGA